MEELVRMAEQNEKGKIEEAAAREQKKDKKLRDKFIITREREHRRIANDRKAREKLWKKSGRCMYCGGRLSLFSAAAPVTASSHKKTRECISCGQANITHK